MNKSDIEATFTAALKTKLIGEIYNKRPIKDVRVSINELELRDTWGGTVYDEITIEVLTTSPTGNIKNWNTYTI